MLGPRAAPRGKTTTGLFFPPPLLPANAAREKKGGIAVVATTASAPFFRKTLRVMLIAISSGTRATQGSIRRSRQDWGRARDRHTHVRSLWGQRAVCEWSRASAAIYRPREAAFPAHPGPGQGR